jgi:hypothetical protein
MSAYKMRESLLEIRCLHPDWWFFPEERFPEERSVHGFLGTGKIFIVGDQPSLDAWQVTHPHRRAFYDLLAAERAGNYHLTDLYKRRGRAGELRQEIPNDFEEHRNVFLKELELLRPSVVLAMGWLSFNLLSKHTPELRSILKRVWHFGVVRHGKLLQFQSSLRGAITAARKEKA